MLYGLLETFWRGHTHWTMMVLAAVLCVSLDLANEYFPWALPLWVQTILGGLVITTGELLAGLGLNVWLGLGIWDYADQWGNLWGQICPLYTGLWCLLAGPVIVGFDWLVVGWVAAMALDYLTGSLVALKGGEWASRKAREGIWHKCGMIVVVLVAAGADMLLYTVLANLPLVTLPFEYAGLVCPVVLVWYIVTELGSIVENAVAMGAPVPRWLVKLLALGKSAVDAAGDKLGGEE